MQYLIGLLLSVAMLLAAWLLAPQCFPCQREGKLPLRDLFRGKSRWLTAFFPCMGLLTAWVTVRSGQLPTAQVKYLLLLSLLFVIAIVDYRQRIIPNRILLLLLAGRLLLLGAELLTLPKSWRTILLNPAVGFLIGGGILLAAMLLSRGSQGVGAGDVKLFAVTGAFVGGNQILGAMLFSMGLSALVAAGLLLLRRAKAMDTIPMAPFVFLGVLLHYLVNLL